jgi:hypothetical protein
MSKVVAGITTSVDGYDPGPDECPGCRLGVGGGRLHYWVFGGPWTDQAERALDELSGEDQAFLETGSSRAHEVVGGENVNLMGGGSIIREALGAGVVDELVISTSPVVLGRGKRLFEGFDHDTDLEKLRVWSSPLAMHVRYGVVSWRCPRFGSVLVLRPWVRRPTPQILPGQCPRKPRLRS